MYLYICFTESYVFYELKENQYYVSFFHCKTVQICYYSNVNQI